MMQQKKSSQPVINQRLPNLILDAINWNSLSAIGSLRLVRTSYLWLMIVPLSARILSQFPDNVTIQLFGAEFTFIFALPFSWKMFYFSALAMAAGTLVYVVKCPPLIKEFKNFTDFERDGSSRLMLKMPMATHALKYPKRRAEFIAFLIQFCGANENQHSREALINELDIKDEKLADAFHYVGGVISTWNTVPRVLCALCYGVGLLLFLVVFFDTLMFVFKFTVIR